MQVLENDPMQEPGQTDNKFVARLGLVAVGAYFLFTCSDLWFQIEPSYFPSFIVLGVPWFCILSGLFLMIMGTVSDRPTRGQHGAFVLILVTHILTQLVYSMALLRNEKVSDTVLLSLEAAALFLGGHNPYGYPMLDVHSAFESTAQAMTPHLDGHLVSVLPYPPLHFLVLVPLLILGLEGARLLFGLCHLMLLILTYKVAPEDFRLLAILPLLMNPEYARFPLSWGSDSLWVLLLGILIWQWSRPALRAVLLGLACAYKQTPWLFAPFLMIKVVKEEGWAAGLKFLGISLGLFLLINLPFAWNHWEPWATGVFNPAVSPMIPYGRGWSLLSQAMVLPFAKSYYSHLSQFVLIVLLWVYWTNFSRLRQALWIFPCFFLFFGFRNLQHYFVFSIPLLVLGLCCPTKEPRESDTKAWFIAPFVTLLVGMVAITALHWPKSDVVSLSVEPGEKTPYPYLTKLKVTVVNSGSEALEPRFFVRTKWHAYPWQIDSGPSSIQPGESVSYRISTDLTYRFLFRRDGGTLLMSDARTSDRYLAQAVFEKEDGLRHPRLVELPPGSLWTVAGGVELEDGIVHFASGPLRPYSSISREIVLPDSPIRLEVKVPFSPDATKSFGLSLRPDRGPAKISVYFGSEEKSGFHNSNHYFKILKTEPDQWTEHEIDLKALYVEAGIALPSLQRVVRNDIELLARPAVLSLDLSSQRENVEAAAKDLSWPGDSSLGRVIQNTQRSKEYLALVGDLALMEGNFERAIRHYDMAQPLDNPRKRAKSDMVWVMSQTTTVGQSSGGNGDLRISLLADSTDQLKFVWNPLCSYTVELDDSTQTLSSQEFWTPPELGVMKLRLKPDRPGVLERIEVKRGEKS